MIEQVLHADLNECENIPEGKNLENLMLDIAKNAKLNVIKSLYHQFSPQGCSVVILIRESHLAIHTYPEDRKVLVDLVTCAENVSFESFKSSLIESFKSRRNTFRIKLRSEFLYE